MSGVLRSLALGLLTLAATILLALSNTITTTAQLLAATLIMRGTNIGLAPPPTDDQYKAFAHGYIQNTVGSHDDPEQIVEYPAGFWPVSRGGLSDPTYDESVATGLVNLHSAADGQNDVVIFGYSQSAVIASKYKQDVVDEFATNPDGAPATKLVLVANPKRPNGGILMRFTGLYIPILNVSFDGSTPTEYPGAGPGEITTYDIAREYDGWADFPLYPLNLVSTANAIAGIVYLHGSYDQIDPAVLNDPTKTDVSTYGDTTYYLIHTDRLPLLMPFSGIVPEPILAALDPVLRVIVDAGYNRNIPYGVPTQAQLIPVINPVTSVSDLGAAVQQGISTEVNAENLPVTTAEPKQTTLAAPSDKTPAVKESASVENNSTASTTEIKSTETTPTAAANDQTPPTQRSERPKVRGPIGADPFKGLITEIQRPLVKPSTTTSVPSTTTSTTAAPANETTATDNSSAGGSASTDSAA